MYLFENPVLQRELLVNLRMVRAFVLLALYLGLLGGVVFMAWPQDATLDLSRNPEAAKRFVNLFFLGQYFLASLMAPSFAAVAITGEKERKTYEMLLASPLRPAAIMLGKLLASLAHLAILVFCSLPIVMICLPLGGVSFYEVLAAYVALMLSVVTFGMISLAWSSYFSRPAASLVVSYLTILPLALLGVALWNAFESNGELRLMLTLTVLPAASGALCIVLFVSTARRLLHPPDVGSEGKEVIDPEQESRKAVGLVIQRDQFPDRLFAPAKRNDLLPDGANPVYDKEMRSEIFSQGTLMLRLVIQVSMFLAVPLMAIWLYIYPNNAPFYISYILLFNVLVGPVFNAGAITSERERQSLDLLLTTVITPWDILWGKLVAGLRVSTVLTSFVVWPLVLAVVMPVGFYANMGSVFFYFLIILMTCLTTGMTALFCSVLFRKTSTALMATYFTIILLYAAPLAAWFFAVTFFPTASTQIAIHVEEGAKGEIDSDKQAIVVAPGKRTPISGDLLVLVPGARPASKVTYTLDAQGEHGKLMRATTPLRVGESFEPEEIMSGEIAYLHDGTSGTTDSISISGMDSQRRPLVPNRAAGLVEATGVASPFAAVFSLPLQFEQSDPPARAANWPIVIGHISFVIFYNLALITLMIWLFNSRWRVAE